MLNRRLIVGLVIVVHIAAATALAMLALAAFVSQACAAELQYSWRSPDRAAKVAELIPGRRIPKLTPDNLFAEWTARKVEQWSKDHEPLSPEEAYKAYSQAKPTDEELTTDFPDHISPFGRVLSGKPDPVKASLVMVGYCPFCGAQTGYYGRFPYAWDSDNPYHTVTNCCGKHLYAREQDFPPDYDLRPGSTVKFLHLDNTVKEVPASTYTDKDGVEWQLFISTLFAYRRWTQVGSRMVVGYMNQFKNTGDPVCAHKIAAILDKVADTYYGLPLCHVNKLATGKDGQPLTRAEWEAVPRPAVFERSYLGSWNRRLVTGSPGWLNMAKEHIWVEPFARVRHHPAFKYYSLKRYGDPDALDRKITTKLLRELKLMFESVFSQRLKSNYQEAKYPELLMLGILLEDESLFDFAAPCQELTLYNHHYHDGMNGEGAPNYMAMLNGYYRYMQDPKGWLEFEPNFVAKNPFLGPAGAELKKLRTVRGLSIEFADQHMWPFHALSTNKAEVRANEKLPSMNWPGFGVGILRVGGPGHRQEIRLSYDKVSLHGCSDKLGIECWVDGVPVMRPGGYAYHIHAAVLDESRPEIKAFRQLDYPKEIVQANTNPRNWCREYGSSHLTQNAVSVDELGTSRGWRDDEGFGELIAFKGGERAGTIGTNFQVLDVRDHDSFDRIGVEVADFRRTLLAVEGMDGRPYVVDILKLRGGQRHALYQSAWGERAGDKLPPVASTETNLARVILGDKPASTLPRYAAHEKVRHVEKLGVAPATWDLTWKTDYAAYALRDPEGKPFVRPLPDDIGRVRLRLMGLQQEGDTQLLRAKGPWVAWIRQPVPKNKIVNGYIAFLDACDFLIETRTLAGDQPDGTLDSTFLHILEGFREGEESVIESVKRLVPAAGPGDTVALKLQLAAGYTDTVIHQPEPGTVGFADGLETDAHYALVRRDAAGEVLEANLIRGTFIKSARFSANHAGDLTGTIVDLIGDLTGTRLESALIIRPDVPWPLGEGLAGKQMLIHVTNPLRPGSNEAYAIQKVTQVPDGLLRVDLANYAPFAAGWHQVARLDPGRPNSLKTNRPFSAGINTSWLHGLKVWFPKAGKTYTFKQTDSSNGTDGAMDLELVEDVDLAAEGVELGDWFAVYAIEPGLRVTVPAEFAWRREPLLHSNPGPGATHQPIRYYLRAWSFATITMPPTESPVWYRSADDTWQQAKSILNADKSAMTITVPAKDSAGHTVPLLANKPDWLKLNDTGPPKITEILLDGQPLELKPVLELGRIPLPRSLVIEVNDDANPIDPNSIAVTLDDKRIDGDSELVHVRTVPGDPKSLLLEVDLARALPPEGREQPARHMVTFTLDDYAVDQAATTLRLSYSKLIKIAAGTIYLSDMKEARSRVHNGLKKDTDYFGKPLRMRGLLYTKSLYAGPEYASPFAYSEIIYDLPQAPKPSKFCAIIGICDNCIGASATGVVFEVQVDKDGEWKTRYKSPTLAGPVEPLAICVDISDTKRLRLYCRDTGDGISADYAVWADARLE